MKKCKINRGKNENCCLPRAARKFNPKRPEVKSGSADSLSKIAASTLRILLPTYILFICHEIWMRGIREK